MNEIPKRTFSGTPESRKAAEARIRANWKIPEGLNNCPKCGSDFVGKTTRSEKIIFCDTCNFQIQGKDYEKLKNQWNNFDKE